MADSSSDSDTYHRNRGNRPGPVRVTHFGPQRRSRINTSGDISVKVETLASTLQDTSRNLNNVDRMLGQYREHTGDQAEAMTTLRDNLEESIYQLRRQRLRRNFGSTIHTSDLDGGSASESHHYRPTLPLRDYRDSKGARGRSRSATVQFVDEMNPLEHVHSLHQSVRDLSSDQLRIGDDIDREIVRRNRTEIETKRTLEDLSSRLRESQRAEAVSERVGRRLQEIEREMRTERQHGERRQDQLGHVLLQRQEALKKHEVKGSEMEEVMKNAFLKTECEKSQIEQELERTRRRLDQSEGGRDTLLQQVYDLRTQLLKTEQDRLDMQQQISQIALLQRSRNEEEEDQRMLSAVTNRSDREKQELEKQIQELRFQLSQNVVISELEELKRSIERKEREKAQLFAHIEVLSSDLDKREKQQLRMLDQLKEIQNRYEDCETDRKRMELHIEDLDTQLKDYGREAEKHVNQLKHAELLKKESDKKKEELKVKAQESIRHWKLKCKKLESDLEKQNETAELTMDKNKQVTKEKETLQGQLHSVMLQMENLHKELSDVISKLAQKEEDSRRKDVELNEIKSQHMDLEHEIREVREVASKLENEIQNQNLLHSQLKNDNQALESKVLVLSRQNEKDRGTLLEMQGEIKHLSAIRAELTSRLSDEEIARKELKKDLADLQSTHDSGQEELLSVGRRIKLERDLHYRELAGLRSEIENLKTKHEKNIQEALRLFRQERDEQENQIRTFKAEATEDKNVVKAQRRQLEKMKIECDKLTEELTQSEEEHTKLKRKYQLLKQELEEKVSSPQTLQRARIHYGCLSLWRNKALRAFALTFIHRLSNNIFKGVNTYCRHCISDLSHFQGKMVTYGGDRLKHMEETIVELQEQLGLLETEQESILCTIGIEIGSVCEVFSRDSDEQFKAISLTSGLQKDSHRWLAEMKTKLHWLREEAKEREGQEKRLRRHLQQSREQLKGLKQNKESEWQLLIGQITKQEQLLEEIHREKRDLLEKTREKDEDVRTLQDRLVELEMSTRLALDHLESVPEKLNLLEDFRDLENSQRQREMIEQRYAKYKEIIGTLQHQLEESKRRIQENRDVKMDTTSQSARLATLSSSIRGQNSFLSSSFLTDNSSPHKRMASPDCDSSQDNCLTNGTKSHKDQKEI
ncbi:centrosomal protein of 128 kDa-like [Polyodon spathula]|uniref:centrosomal protein of 128 kDa-like n=1 Tax=Polyodon spathula TaxID=7913 RepID=UPI001B7E7C42|nr:centrosomal protein of 128 kDa-like [Polyodon spathula]